MEAGRTSRTRGHRLAKRSAPLIGGRVDDAYRRGGVVIVTVVLSAERKTPMYSSQAWFSCSSQQSSGERSGLQRTNRAGCLSHLPLSNVV